MGRKKGTFSLSANLEVKAAAPLDPRELVDTLEDLTANDTFPYPYEGMEVYVKSEKKKYRLIGDDTTVAANWTEVGTGGSQTLAELDDVDINLIEWDTKTWTGLTNFEGDYIWSDGENIYYSYSSNQYVLDKSTSTWSIKTWNGLTNIYGNHIWTDGENIYYSYGSSNQYVLDKSTSTWSPKKWTGLTNYIGDYIWTDGENIYYSGVSDQYILDKSTSTWSPKIWSGLTNFYGPGTWSDGDNIYYSVRSNQYVLDKSTSTWSPKTWTGLTELEGAYIWLDGENIYYSYGSNQYILDKSTSTWLPKTWTGLTNFDSFYIWTDGNNIYYSRDTRHYKLNHTDEALIYDWANQKWINKEIASKEDIPKIFTGTQAEWDALTTDKKLTYKQVNITDDESGTPEYYSTEEVKTGKVWIDGKDIYRRVVTKELNTYTDSSSRRSFTDIIAENVDSVITKSGMVKVLESTDPGFQSNPNVLIPQASVNNNMDLYWICFCGYNNNHDISFYFNVMVALGVTKLKYSVIIEYTKTTD